MKEKKYTQEGVFCRLTLLILWFLFLVALVDGVGLFNVMESCLGFAATEIILWTAVLAVAVPVAIYLYRYFSENR